MAVLKNRAGVSCATTGTGTITLGAALPAGTAINSNSWQTFAAAGVTDGQSVRYLILDSNGAWEYGPGTYTATGTTLSRPATAMDGSVAGQKSSTGALLSLSGNAQVFITAVSEDIAPLDSPTFTGDPKAPTPVSTDNDTSIATTAFVKTNLGNYLPLAGGTLTGSLVLDYAAPVISLHKTASGQASSVYGNVGGSSRWAIDLGDSAAESGSNVGSDFRLRRFNDAGGALADAIAINRADGAVTSTGDLSISKANPSFVLAKAAAAQINGLYAYNGANLRWSMYMGNSTAEGGSNAGSDFVLNRYSDAGSLIATAITVARSSGLMTLQGDMNVVKANPTLELRKAASGETNAIFGKTSINSRWALHLGNTAAESGSNAGSNFAISRYSDAGAGIDSPFHITRSNGAITIGPLANGVSPGGQIGFKCSDTVSGLIAQQNVAGVGSVAAAFLNSTAATSGYILITDSSTTYSTTSDIRLKENEAPFTRGREVLDKLAVKGFDFSGTSDKGVGLMAQDAYQAFPQAVVPGLGEPGEEGFRPWGIDYSKYVPVLIQALQAAFKEIDELKARLGP